MPGPTDPITGKIKISGAPDSTIGPEQFSEDIVGRISASGEEHALGYTYAPTMASSGGAVGLNMVVTPAGSAGAWCSAFYGKVVQTGSKRVSGYISAAEFEVVLGGTYNPSAWAVLVLNATDNNTGGAALSAYIYLRDYGSRDMECLMRFLDEARASASDAVLISQMPQTPFDTSIRCMVGTTAVWLYGSTVGPASIANFKWIGTGATKYLEIDATNDRVNMALMGFKWTSASFTGKCLDFTDVVLAAGSTNNILSMGDSTAKEVTITDYFFPIRLNLASVANPSGGILAALMFLKFAVTTIDQANLDMQGIGLTMESAFNVGYIHGLDIGVNLTDTLTVSNSVHAGKFGINRTTAKTITGPTGGSMSAVLAQISGNGVNAGFGGHNAQGAAMEAKLLDAADVDCMLWLNLLNGTTATHAIVVGNGVTGNITNLFRFVRDSTGNAVKVGAACQTDSGSGVDSDGAIRILVGATEYFIPFYTAGNTDGSW